MVTLEDVVNDIEGNGGTVLSIDDDGIVYTITYLDSSNTQVVEKYRKTILDDGSEELTKL